MNILVVDDNAIARESICRSFQRAGADFRIVGAEDGVEALEILRRQSKLKQLQGEVVVILDLLMPRMDGCEFLKVLRANAKLRDTAVFILSTSNAEEHKARATDLDTVGYIVKSARSGPLRGACQISGELLQGYRNEEIICEH